MSSHPHSPPTLGDAISTVEKRRQTFVVYSSDDDPSIVDQFALQNVDIVHRRLPSDRPNGFVVLRNEADEFVGSISLDELELLLEPPISRPWNDAVLAEGYRALYEVLSHTVFTSLDRRQLLGTAREIENRAWRVGEGTLWVGFQRFSAMAEQVDVYTKLADETALEIHAFGEDDWDLPPIPGVTCHAESAEEIGRFWFLLFDGGGDDDQACALVAEECSPGEYFGFWTYDHDLVEELTAHVRTTYA